MEFSIETITPELAEQYLESNPINRKVSHSRILFLANEMREGRWTMNGATISFGTTGRLLDGQHRLYAIREYGKPMEMAIARNVPESAFETIDTGRARSAADVAQMEGVTNPNISTGASALFWRVWWKIGPTATCPTQTVLRIIERYPEIIKWSNPVNNVRKPLTAPGSAFVVGLVYLSAIAQKPMLADRFFNGLAKGEGLQAKDPLLALRNRFLGMRTTGLQISSGLAWSLICRTIDAMEAEERLSAIYVSSSTGANLAHPKLWDIHLQSLPSTKNLNLLGGPAQSSSAGGRKLFKEMVQEHKALSVERLGKK